MTAVCARPEDHEAVAVADPAALAADPDKELDRMHRALRVCARCGLPRSRWKDTR